MIDEKVQQILDESKKRVTTLLTKHEKQIREISINLYKYDYLNKEEIETVMQGKKLDKSLVREFDSRVEDYAIKF